MPVAAPAKTAEKGRRTQPESTAPEPAPRHAPPGPHAALLDLQRIAGNRAVGQLLQSGEGNSRAARGAASILQSVLNGGGQSLDSATRDRMGSHLGQDLSDVRIHIDAQAAESARAVNARAFAVGRDVVFGAGEYAPETVAGRQLLAHELTHTVQQRSGAQRLPSTLEITDPGGAAEQEARAAAAAVSWGRAFTPSQGHPVAIAREDKAPPPGEKLLKSFAAKFKDAADLIRKSAAAMKLVAEAEAAGVKFGGHAEDGPGKDLGRAYTSGNTVYVPKARTDPVLAMKSFLFELNNAIRAPKFAELATEAAKGTKGSLTAKQYAYRNVELEVEGMLRLGEVWFETRKTFGKDPKWDKYDADFYFSEYKAWKERKKTKDEIVKDVLKRVYETGTLKGKTVEQYYMDAYNRLSGGK